MELQLEIQEKEYYLFYIIYFKRQQSEMHVIYKDEEVNKVKYTQNKNERSGQYNETIQKSQRLSKTFSQIKSLSQAIQEQYEQHNKAKEENL